MCNIISHIVYRKSFPKSIEFVFNLIAIFGFTLTKKLKWAANRNGKFRKLFEIVFFCNWNYDFLWYIETN